MPEHRHPCGCPLARRRWHVSAARIGNTSLGIVAPFEKKCGMFLVGVMISADQRLGPMICRNTFAEVDGNIPDPSRSIESQGRRLFGTWGGLLPRECALEEGDSLEDVSGSLGAQGRLRAVLLIFSLLRGRSLGTSRVCSR